MRAPIQKTYSYFVTLPDRFYPFGSDIEGQWVRGRRSYNHALARAKRKYGVGHVGYKLALYRSIFHFVGSLLFITLATLVSKKFFGSEVALYVLFIAATAALSYQEFYMQPRSYGQHIQKGVADWLTWVLPMLLYALFFK